MEERSTQEYWTFVGYRDYWGRELASVNAQVQVLEERIAALNAAIRAMRVQEDRLRTLLSGVMQIPSVCGQWQGARAAELFMQCTEGSLFCLYRGAADEAGELTGELEAARNARNVQLDEMHTRRTEAGRIFDYWCGRVACYW